jgi:hypothetical protein
VNRPEPVKVVLELEHDERTICGRIVVNDHPGRDFYGWLELIHRLERATDSEQPHGGDPNMASEDEGPLSGSRGAV